MNSRRIVPHDLRHCGCGHEQAVACASDHDEEKQVPIHFGFVYLKILYIEYANSKPKAAISSPLSRFFFR